jgi:CheY-like chemotaxis protein
MAVHDAMDAPAILIVDDDRVDVKAIQRALRATGVHHRAFEARDGVEALEMLGVEGDSAVVPSPCLVVLDLNMPRMNGLEFLQAVRGTRRYEGLRVLVLTTSDAKQDRQAASSFGPVDYVMKSSDGSMARVAEVFRLYCSKG